MTNKDIVCTPPSIPVAIAIMLRPEHWLDARKVVDRLLTSGTAELRIHDEIERGDNESIKQGSGLISSGEGCCGGAA